MNQDEWAKPYFQSVRAMPKQKPGKSVQDVGTPDWLIALVERTWGKITYDAAASLEHHCAHNWSDGKYSNGLETDWSVESMAPSRAETDFADIVYPGLTWCNPPYSDIQPWVEKAGSSRSLVVMLVPASVGSNWWAQFVDGQAMVYFIRPRLVFKGHTSPYPKDCALLVYGAEKPGYRCVRLDEHDLTVKIGDGTYD